MIQIGDRISHYKIVEKLGAGGMGVVYKAEDLKLNRTIALKFLPADVAYDDDSKLRFIREAQTASAMQHTNICTIHDIDETNDGAMYICMDYYDGESLKDKIRQAPLSQKVAIEYIIQICDGLERAHESGVYHRDIKPANIMLTSRGEIKIVDFGLVKLAGEQSKSDRDKTVGTIQYMSPEQIRGEDVDQSSDIWSLGVVFYELLTGRLPFESSDKATLLSYMRDSEPVLNPEASPLQPIVSRCLNSNVEERYQGIKELCCDLHDYLTSGRST